MTVKRHFDQYLGLRLFSVTLNNIWGYGCLTPLEQYLGYRLFTANLNNI